MGIGFMGILSLMFIAFKMLGIISWSWWLVLLPMYGGPVLAVVCILLAIAMGKGPKLAKMVKKKLKER